MTRTSMALAAVAFVVAPVVASATLAGCCPTAVEIGAQVNQEIVSKNATAFMRAHDEARADADRRVHEATRKARRSAVQQVIDEAEKCKPFPVRVDDHQVELVNTACLDDRGGMPSPGT